MNHPHILGLHDSGQADDLLFYVMPYVRGESLRQMLQRKTRLSIEEAIHLTRQVAAALDYAHAHDIVHRDIKPENILLHEGEAMVMDFGIACVLDRGGADPITSTGLVVGTPIYMSPEQVAGQPPLDARTDVYSLGCVLYEMLVGEPPFSGPSAAAVVRARLFDTAPDVRQRRADVPPAVNQALRKALAPDRADRFASAGAFAAALSEAFTQPRTPSVAVLPFLNMSADPENEYFADGITEDVIAQLSKVPALKVISRTSVMRFKKRDADLQQIAAQLNAATLLDGSVRRVGTRVRIVAQLIDAATDQHLWAETYDRELTDIFAIQTDVALHIAAALNAELSADEKTRIRQPPTTDLDAYQLYLQGRHCMLRFTEEGMRKGIAFFERAIARDRTYALAHAGAAFAYLELAETGAMKPAVAQQHAREAIAAALSLDSTLGEAHCMRGQLLVQADFDWPGAEAAFKRALQLSPSNADACDFYGRLCASLGRFDEAIALNQRAQELDPLAHRADFATTLIRARRFDEALTAAKAAVEFDPHYDRAHATLGWAYLKHDMPAEGLAEVELAVRLSPENTGWLAQLGEAYGLTGRQADARRILERLESLSQERYVSPYHFAYVHTGLGDYDRAIDYLERACEDRAGAVHGIGGSFLFWPLHGHPRFTARLRKMRLA